MNKFSVKDTFRTLIYRPIDPFWNLCLKNIDESRHLIHIEEYHSRVKKGMNIFKDKKIIITGLIHNAQSQIQPLQIWFDTISNLCLDCHIVMVENNSIDQTRYYCEEWQRTNPEKVHLVCNKYACDKTWTIRDIKGGESDRIEKMAFLRNLYCEYIKENLTFVNFDYVFVLDFDLRGTIFWDGIFDSIYYFSKDPRIDAIACNGMVSGSLLYYDSFAFARDRSELRWTNHLDKQNHDEDVLRYVSEEYQNSQELDKLSSAFGGFCIYNYNSFILSEYGFEEKFYTCEHCVFHERMKNFYLNPNMVFIIDENLT
jgi:hypothetical protein